MDEFYKPEDIPKWNPTSCDRRDSVDIKLHVSTYSCSQGIERVEYKYRVLALDRTS